MKRNYQIILSLIVGFVYSVSFQLFPFRDMPENPFKKIFWIMNYPINRFDFFWEEKIISEDLVLIGWMILLSIVLSFIYGSILGYLSCSIFSRILKFYGKDPNKCVFQIPVLRFVLKNYNKSRWILFFGLPFLYLSFLFFFGLETNLISNFYNLTFFKLVIFFREHIDFSQCAAGESFCTGEMINIALVLSLNLIVCSGLGYALGYYLEKLILKKRDAQGLKREHQ